MNDLCLQKWFSNAFTSFDLTELSETLLGTTAVVSLTHQHPQIQNTSPNTDSDF